MSKKALLMILDGWGLGDQKKDDVIFNTPTPYCTLSEPFDGCGKFFVTLKSGVRLWFFHDFPLLLSVRR